VESAHGYRYVGPADLAARARPGPDVITVASAQVLTRWLASRPADELGESFTFAVGLDGQLRLAPRRSEHVDCAAGTGRRRGPVRARRATWSVSEISNQSTGYCPDPDSWPVVASALGRIGLAHPGDFTDKFIFRRCPACGQLNVVRDGSFACAICDSALPARWNIGPA
jgi:hypothetical protein